ncbi:cytochrome P450 [Desarmillaria tabescens]|uniref:Cytochrome P450 n=1 Tax=Armillaria tabescens TaxID=1929756 RepID=A0AA39N7N8_ARMTA|nr:cytochrome P450 [Desarmillaria tabescens]KAK0460552.1 cytochrome P450 [Desarmillaria tabescens]
MPFYIIAFLLLGAVLHLWRRKSHNNSQSRGLPLPPGPPGLPCLGNLLDIPIHRPWIKFTEWKTQFGDLFYMKALGRGILVLNTMDTVVDLLNDKANLYSDRPTFVMVGDMMGLDNSVPMLPYGSTFKQHRKLCHMSLNPETVKQYHSLQEDAVAMYLSSILDTPHRFIKQLRLTAGRIIMSVTYGISVQTPEDIYITEAETTMEMIGKSTVPGAHLVDFVPALRYIPSWVPFNIIPSMAEYGRNLIWSMISRPFEHVKRDMASGTARPSFTRTCLENFETEISGLSRAEQDHLVRWAAGAMYGAGGESTYASILSFIVAMALFPDVQRKIQQEIDSVVGADRLPTVKDRARMPYIEATMKEVLRWKPALPLSIARKTNKADYYKGYYIPEGTIVMPNVWAISIDDKSGIPSAEFAPERHIKECVSHTATDPATYAFGFGRRVCPGRHLGENNLFLLISGLMATVNIEKPKDLSGRELPFDPSYKSGLVTFPEDYKVGFSCRSAEISMAVKEKVSQIVS